MHLSKPRIAPVNEEEWTEEQQAYLKPYVGRGAAYNVFRTLARHPELASRFNAFAGYILRDSTLPARDREILILRIGWLCKAEYEFAQHSRLGLAAGLSEDEIKGITEGPDAPGWTAFESVLLRAVDELHENAFLTDETWNALSEQYSEQQLMDLVFTVGDYNMVSMALNTFGVQLDEGLKGFPE